MRKETENMKLNEKNLKRDSEGSEESGGVKKRRIVFWEDLIKKRVLVVSK